MANEKVRNALKTHHVHQWQLATMMGISENTICRKLRIELPETEQKAMIDLIIKGKEKK